MSMIQVHADIGFRRKSHRNVRERSREPESLGNRSGDGRLLVGLGSRAARAILKKSNEEIIVHPGAK